MLRKIRRSINTVLSLLITTPVFAHESFDHILGYRHEAHNSLEFVGIVFAIAAIFFIASLLLKGQKKDSNK